MDNLEKLKKLVSEVLGIEKDTITSESNPDVISEWNSVSHINLMLAIEEVFSVDLMPEDAAEMISIKLIIIVLEEKGIRF